MCTEIVGAIDEKLVQTWHTLERQTYRQQWKAPDGKSFTSNTEFKGYGVGSLHFKSFFSTSKIVHQIVPNTKNLEFCDLQNYAYMILDATRL